MSTQTTGASAPSNAPLRPYRIHCAGLQYIALATSACKAIEQAIALHCVAGASAKHVKGGAA